MTQTWDEAIKKMIEANPQAIVNWLVPGGQFVKILSTEFLKENEEPLHSDDRYEIAIKGNPWISLTETQMYDILKESPLFHRWTKQAVKEAREEGLEKGREQGRQEALQQLRQAVITIVLERFPKLARLATKQLAVVEDTTVLQHVLVKVSLAPTMEDAQQHLLALDDDDNN